MSEADMLRAVWRPHWWQAWFMRRAYETGYKDAIDHAKSIVDRAVAESRERHDVVDQAEVDKVTAAFDGFPGTSSKRVRP